MDVYVIALCDGGGDFFGFYVYNEMEWDKMDDRALHEQVDERKKLGRYTTVVGLFNAVREHGWNVIDSAEGPSC